jgi:hypothetical protein
LPLCARSYSDLFRGVVHDPDDRFTTVVSRNEIPITPGADLTNNFNMIADFVDGASMAHGQLRVGGGPPGHLGDRVACGVFNAVPRIFLTTSSPGCAPIIRSPDHPRPPSPAVWSQKYTVTASLCKEQGGW